MHTFPLRILQEMPNEVKRKMKHEWPISHVHSCVFQRVSKTTLEIHLQLVLSCYSELFSHGHDPELISDYLKKECKFVWAAPLS